MLRQLFRRLDAHLHVIEPVELDPTGDHGEHARGKQASRGNGDQAALGILPIGLAVVRVRQRGIEARAHPILQRTVPRFRTQPQLRLGIGQHDRLVDGRGAGMPQIDLQRRKSEATELWLGAYHDLALDVAQIRERDVIGRVAIAQQIDEARSGVMLDGHGAALAEVPARARRQLFAPDREAEGKLDRRDGSVVELARSLRRRERAEHAREQVFTDTTHGLRALTFDVTRLVHHAHPDQVVARGRLPGLRDARAPVRRGERPLRGQTIVDRVQIGLRRHAQRSRQAERLQLEDDCRRQRIAPERCIGERGASRVEPRGDDGDGIAHQRRRSDHAEALARALAPAANPRRASHRRANRDAPASACARSR